MPPAHHRATLTISGIAMLVGVLAVLWATGRPGPVADPLVANAAGASPGLATSAAHGSTGPASSASADPDPGPGASADPTVPPSTPPPPAENANCIGTSNPVARADELLANRYKLGSQPIVKLPANLRWTEN